MKGKYSKLAVITGVAGAGLGFYLGREFVEFSDAMFDVGALERVIFYHPMAFQVASGIILGAAGTVVGGVVNQIYEGICSVRKKFDSRQSSTIYPSPASTPRCLLRNGRF